MPALIEADDAVRRVIEQMAERDSISVVVGAGDLALYCDERLLTEAITTLLQAARGYGDGAEITLTVDGEDQYVCFSAAGERAPAGLVAGAEHLGGLVRIDDGRIVLLVPSANWSPSHRH